jgi:hypothetical protein
MTRRPSPCPISPHLGALLDHNEAVSAPPLRTWWKWTIVANLAAIAMLLIGWATDSGVLLALGFIVLVSSLGVRIAAQLSSRRRPR